MLRCGLTFYDSAGRRHPSPRAALIHELADALGFDGANATLSTTIAVLVVEKRAAVEQAFSGFDQMVAAAEEHGA